MLIHEQNERKEVQPPTKFESIRLLSSPECLQFVYKESKTHLCHPLFSVANKLQLFF